MFKTVVRLLAGVWLVVLTSSLALSAPVVPQLGIDPTGTTRNLYVWDSADWVSIGSVNTSSHAWSLESPTALTLGGIFSSSAGTGEVATGIDTSGNVVYSAPFTLTTTGTTGASTFSGGTLNIPNYAGTVTSVGLSAPSIFTVSGSPVVGSGTLALGYSGTALPIANGGTGNTTGLAASATKLATARAINGVNFDGTAAITVPAAAGTLTGTTLASNVVSTSITSVGTIATGTWQGSSIADSYISSAAAWNAKLSNITGLVTAGSGVTITGSGTSGSPYSIAAAATGGSVTSVGMTVPTGLTVSGQPITTSGTLALSWSGTTPCAQMPALTGSVASAGATCATSIASSVNLSGSPTTTTQTAGDSSTKIATTAFVQGAALWAPGSINGCTLSPSSTTVLGIAICSAREESGTPTNMAIATAWTKSIASAWAAGTGNGAMFTGSGASASTWYHAYLIRKDSDGSLDYGLDSTYPPTHLPSGYSTYRRLGSILTDASSHIISFVQIGNQFLWSSQAQDYNAAVATASAQLITLSVPPAVNVQASILALSNSASATVFTYFSSPLVTAETPPTSNPMGFPVVQMLGGANAADELARSTRQMELMTNTSSQIRFQNSAANSITVVIATLGWRDPRGQN